MTDNKQPNKMTTTNTQKQPSGGETASPTAASFKIEPIEWVTDDEALKYNRMMFKNYVKCDANGKATKDSDEFFYKIISAHPFVPANIITQSNQNLIKFEVQKFYRNKMVTKKMRDGGSEKEYEDNQAVDWVAVDDMGNARILDPEANQMIESRDFLKRFIPDSN